MDGREVRSHISNVVDLLSEILAEVKGLRRELVEQRAMYTEVTCESDPIDFDKLIQDSFHTTYER